MILTLYLKIKKSMKFYKTIGIARTDRKIYEEGSEKLNKLKLSKIKVLLIEQIYIKTITK